MWFILVEIDICTTGNAKSRPPKVNIGGSETGEDDLNGILIVTYNVVGNDV